MGLYDRIKRSVMQITGKDPESQADGSLYRYVSRKDGGLTTIAGTVPFNHFGFQPDACPPGWAYNQAGKVYPIVRDVGTTTPTVALPVEIWSSQVSTRDPVGDLIFTGRTDYVFHDASGTKFAANADPPAWKPLYKSQALTAGAAANTVLLAAVSAKKFDVAIHDVSVIPVTAAAATSILLTYQDEDDAAVTGCLTTNVPSYVFDTSTPRYNGVPGWSGDFGACRFITPTANKALEVDITGGAGAETVIIRGMYRQV